MSKRFGFQVEYQADDEEFDERAGWRVKLPHQCDAWDIAGEVYTPVPQDVAVAELERFIAEAQEALAALRSGEQFGGTR